MSDFGATTLTSDNRTLRSAGFREDCAALVIIWSGDQPERVGEVALFSTGGSARILGRGPQPDDDPDPRVQFLRQRPAVSEPAGVLTGPGISRRQLRLSAAGRDIAYERVGKAPVLHNGVESDSGTLAAGDTIAVKNQLVLQCVRRPVLIEPIHAFIDTPGRIFGAPDELGFVGESPAAWALRDKMAFIAERTAHVLVLGDSGSGKELIAQAIHQLSPRGDKQLISRNAATFPAGLIDAELFGNVEGYPNPGMRARKGLIGEADGSSLFLDEIGELETEMQAHLLRVLDGGGEYHRLGEAKARQADVRLIAATNRPKDHLKHDFLARLPLRIESPGLDERPEDVPLIAAHLLRVMAADDPMIERRFFFEGWPQLDPLLADALGRHQYTHHVRELSGFLLRAMASSPGDAIWLTDDVRQEMRFVDRPGIDPATLTAAEIQEALDRCDGNQSRAYKELGLKNRDALYRLIKKHGLVVRR